MAFQIATTKGLKTKRANERSSSTRRTTPRCPHPMLQLQQTIGNQNLLAFLASQYREADDPHQIAEDGVSSMGTQLPYMAKIQSAFGAYDIRNVKAHLDQGAASATERLGAKAYATGERIAFSDTPDLHTAAHEAAHVIQQRRGVTLSGGVGTSEDEYERHADNVADAVVQGKSAEALLDRYAPPRTVESAPPIQRKRNLQFNTLRPVPGGNQIKETRGDPDPVLNAMNALSRTLRRGGTDFFESEEALIIQNTLARGNLSTDFIPINHLDTSGINTRYVGHVRLRIGASTELDRGQGSFTAAGGGASTSGSSRSTTEGSTAGGSLEGTVGGHQGAPGGTVGVSGEVSSSETRGSSQGTSATSTTRGQTTERFVRYGAPIYAIITLRAELDFSGSDYVNPFKWGTAIGNELFNQGSRSLTVACGTVEYQRAVGIVSPD